MSIEIVSDFLLKNKFLLTGLELLQECKERNLEIPKDLAEFYTLENLDRMNKTDDITPFILALPDNPPRPKLTTKDYDRIALLEYELRQERQNLQTLRREISALLSLKEEEVNKSTSEESKSFPATPTERRILNYLVKKYLSSCGYHRTAVALSSEAEFDANSWTAATKLYGSFIKEPPPLINLLRNYYGTVPTKNETERVYEMMEKVLMENARLHEQLEAKEKQIKQMTAMEQTIELLRAELADANTRLLQEREKLLVLQSSLKEESLRSERFAQALSSLPQLMPPPPPPPTAGSSAQNNVSGDAHQTSVTIEEQNKQEGKQDFSDAPISSLMPELVVIQKQQSSIDPLHKKRRDFSYLFRREEPVNETSYRIASEVLKIKTMANKNTSVVSILASCLPHVLSGVILVKREELLPLILCCVCWHPDPSKRSELMSLLFNIVKVPNDQQRNIIIDGLIYLAELLGTDRTSDEIIPQIMEQINSKFEERRILVADACGWLAPYVKPELRLSLLLSILQSLSGDKSPLVRAAIPSNMARLLHLEDGSEPIDLKKFQQLADLLFALIQDTDPVVAIAAKGTLLPVFCDYSERMHFFQQRFLPVLPHKMLQLIEKSPKTLDNKTIREIDLIADILTYLMPQIFESSLVSLPFYDEVSKNFDTLPAAPLASGESHFVSMFSEHEKKQLRQHFDEFMETYKKRTQTKDQSSKSRHTSYDSNSTFEWVVYDLVPSLLSMIKKTDLSNHDTSDTFAHLLKILALEFGSVFTTKLIEPKFKSLLDRYAKSTKPEAHSQWGRLSVAYASSILATFSDQKQLKTFFNELIVNVSLKQQGWPQMRYPELQDIILAFIRRTGNLEIILEILWELIVHRESKVRRNVAKLFAALIPLTKPALLSKRIVPALVTLSSDSDVHVKQATVRGFSDLIPIVDDKQLIEKINVIMTQFIEDQPKFRVITEVINAITNILPRVSSSYRDEFLLSRLESICEYAVEFDEDEKKQKELAELLLGAYRALYGSSIPINAVRDSLLPGLKRLEKIIGLCDNQFKTQLSEMISNLEATVREVSDSSRAEEAKESSSSLLGLFSMQWKTPSTASSTK